MAIREYWISLGEDLGEDCDDIVWHYCPKSESAIHVIDATGMPSKKEIKMAIKQMDDGEIPRPNTPFEKVVMWLESLAAE